jgi:hypothetical protein
MNTKAPKLMPLRIPAHWAVSYNDFYDVEPIIDKDSDSEFYKNCDYFTQSLLQIVKTTLRDGNPAIDENALLIDLGHYPDGAINGEYQLQLVKPLKGEMDWENAETFQSKNRFEIVAKLEQWLEQYAPF